jgi:3-oxoacyl-[acyl-carrier protein] reductase
MPKEDAQALQRNDSQLFPLTGKTALVTGASRGIGRAIALRLGGLGAGLLLVARDERALGVVQQHIAEAGGSADVLLCDLTSSSQIAKIAGEIDSAGGCDILVNAAGIGKLGAPLHEMPVEDFDAILATNLRAPFLLMRAVVPHMIERGGGHVINISSLAGASPLPNGAAYSASKWAVNGLSYSVAEELRAHNIRVSVVAPGSVNTEFGRGGQSSAGKIKDTGKMLQPEDVAGVVALLVTQPPQSFISEIRMRPTQKP